MARPERKDFATAFGLSGVITAIAPVVFGDVRSLIPHVDWENWCRDRRRTKSWLSRFTFGEMFGHLRAQGFAFAMLGAVIAGNFVRPFLGTHFAPTALLDQGIACPAIALVWLFLMARF